jgi:hypothetical protein
MQTREIVGLCLIPIALLLTAGTLNLTGVGSVVWFGAMLASAILILALVSFCFGLSPSTVSFRSLMMVYIACVIIVGLGVIIRIIFHEEITALRQLPFDGRQQRPINWAFVIISGLYEWLSFSGVLGVVFLTVKRFGQPESSQPAATAPDVSQGVFRS